MKGLKASTSFSTLIGDGHEGSKAQRCAKDFLALLCGPSASEPLWRTGCGGSEMARIYTEGFSPGNMSVIVCVICESNLCIFFVTSCLRLLQCLRQTATKALRPEDARRFFWCCFADPVLQSLCGKQTVRITLCVSFVTSCLRGKTPTAYTSG